MNGKHWACSCLSLCFLVLSEVGSPPSSSFIPHLLHNTLSYQSFYSLKQCFLGTFFCPCFSSALQLSSSSCSCWVNPYPSRPGEKKNRLPLLSICFCIQFWYHPNQGYGDHSSQVVWNRYCLKSYHHVFVLSTPELPNNGINSLCFPVFHFYFSPKWLSAVSLHPYLCACQ